MKGIRMMKYLWWVYLLQQCGILSCMWHQITKVRHPTWKNADWINFGLEKIEQGWRPAQQSAERRHCCRLAGLKRTFPYDVQQLDQSAFGGEFLCPQPFSVRDVLDSLQCALLQAETWNTYISSFIALRWVLECIHDREKAQVDIWFDALLSIERVDYR